MVFLTTNSGASTGMPPLPLLLPSPTTHQNQNKHRPPSQNTPPQSRTKPEPIRLYLALIAGKISARAYQSLESRWTHPPLQRKLTTLPITHTPCPLTTP